MAKKVAGLEQLLVEELQDLFDVEKQLVRALPKLAKSVSDGELANALREHLEVTKGQVQRLEKVFQSLDQRARSKPCKGMKGLVEEAQEIMGEDHEEAIMDMALAAAARKVEHYEIVGYESVRALARQLGFKDAAQLLEQTLQEETQTDSRLAQIVKRLLKEGTASQGSPKPEETEKAKARPREAGRAGRPITDHEEIRRWAGERGAEPACVKGTGDRSDTGMIRLDFPGYSGKDSLEPISWDDWFEKFDENSLALVVQETTASGQKSNFNKLVSRATVESKTRSAR